MTLHEEVHDERDHRLFLLGAGLGDHKRHRHEQAVRHPLLDAAEKRPITVEEVQEEAARDALVAVDERMVLDDKVQQVGSLLLDRG